MCGIAGIINKAGSIDPGILEAMGDTLNHRGPDDKGAYLGPGAGLIHRRLSVIDIEGGQQPMTDSFGLGNTIVFNGEIYNYKEIKKELQSFGYKFKTQSDTEVLLAAYLRWGRNCLCRLRGMFAFAIYNRDLKELFLARDPFGIKPLYYYMDREVFLFASEIKALLKHPRVRREMNYEGMEEYVHFQFCLENKTLFKNISKVSPAQWIRIKDGMFSDTGHYWKPSFEINYDYTKEYYANRLKELLTESIQEQTVCSDVPVGAYLSGGLDSSTVACLSGVENVFTGSFDEPGYSETYFAGLVSDHIGASHNTIWPNENDFIEDISKLIYFMDEPAGGPGLFPQYFVSKLASDKVKVILGGQGGDEIFGGYARYVIAYLEQCLIGAIRGDQDKGPFVVTLDTIVSHLPLLKEYLPMLGKFWSGDGFGSDQSRRYFDLINRFDSKYYTEDYLHGGVNRTAVYDRYLSLFDEPGMDVPYINKMTYFDMRTLLGALLQVEDRMSMAVSIESRVPFLDTRIVELSMQMPPAYKFADGDTKHILKRAMRDIVPSQILERRDKMGFPVPLGEWIKEDPLREFMHDMMDGKSGMIKPYSGVDGFDRGLWGALCIELWHKEVLNG